MAIRKVSLAVIQIQDGGIICKATVRSDNAQFESNFGFDLGQCPELEEAALALDHQVRSYVHAALGIPEPEPVKRQSKLAVN